MIVPATVLLVVLFVIAALAEAAMDSLHHHWGRSVFYSLAGGDKLHWWGHANEVWRRRYEGGNPQWGATPRYKWFKDWQLGFLYETFADGWHAMKALKHAAFLAAVAVACLFAGDLAHVPYVWLWLPVGLGVLNRGVFGLAYHHLFLD